MTTSTIGSRDDAIDLAAELATIAGALQKRTEPLDADAQVLDSVAVEIALVAEAPGDWPHEILTKGRVLVWAGSIMSVVHHLEEMKELETTRGRLRTLALRLQGHAEGLRSTGQWVAQGEPEPVDDEAPTEPLMRRRDIKQE